MKEVYYNKNGICLAEWLGKHHRELTGYNVFYIVQPVADIQRSVSVFKFGIAISPRNGSANRLRHYVHQHGRMVRGSCLGVKLLYLAKTKNNEENVEYKNTDVFRNELYMKQYVKKMKKLLPMRGGERTRMELDKFIWVLKKLPYEDIETDLKRSERQEKAKIKAKKPPKYKVGQIWMLNWEGGDEGGSEGDYQAELLKINKNSMIFKYLDDDYVQRIYDNEYLKIKAFVSDGSK